MWTSKREPRPRTSDVNFERTLKKTLKKNLDSEQRSQKKQLKSGSGESLDLRQFLIQKTFLKSARFHGSNAFCATLFRRHFCSGRMMSIVFGSGQARVVYWRPCGCPALHSSRDREVNRATNRRTRGDALELNLELDARSSLPKWTRTSDNNCANLKQLIWLLYAEMSGRDVGEQC